MNRSPTAAVKDQTLDEAWSAHKPSVDHFKVFGCVAHAHIPNQKRTKLDDKSTKCVFLGLIEGTKAYRLYNPVSDKIIVNRDVVFEENESWEWNKSKERSKAVFVWGDEEEDSKPNEREGKVEEGIESNEHHDGKEEETNPSNHSSKGNTISPLQGRMRNTP